MPRNELYSLRLPSALFDRSTTLVKLLARALGISRSAAQLEAPAFGFRNDERGFVEQLVRRKPNLWVFRSHQRRFCGDFLVVDMSCPRPVGRQAWALDLKQGAELRVGGGGAGVQFRNVLPALQQIADLTGAVPAEANCELVSGDAAEILRLLGAA